MSYLDRLKAQFPENCPAEALTKLTEAPFVSSVSTRVGQKKASDAQQDPDPSLDEALPGVSPEFRARLSAEDLADIAAGDIAPETVQTIEAAAIREAEDLRGHFEERAGIIEHAGLPRVDAELEAARITATLARNKGYLWSSLRSALSGYPALAPQVPDRPGPVDSLPFGTATVHVREGRTVVRQGTFTGAQEVAEARGSDA